MALLLREAIGAGLRRARTARRRTLRDVSRRARVSLGYLSEVERGRKEPSSELLAAICDALDVALPDLLTEAAHTMAGEAAVPAPPDRPAPDGPAPRGHGDRAPGRAARSARGRPAAARSCPCRAARLTSRPRRRGVAAWIALVRPGSSDPGRCAVHASDPGCR